MRADRTHASGLTCRNLIVLAATATAAKQFWRKRRWMCANEVEYVFIVSVCVRIKAIRKIECVLHALRFQQKIQKAVAAWGAYWERQVFLSARDWLAAEDVAFHPFNVIALLAFCKPNCHCFHFFWHNVITPITLRIFIFALSNKPGRFQPFCTFLARNFLQDKRWGRPCSIYLQNKHTVHEPTVWCISR